VIATLTGVVAEREGESLVVQTDGGVGYAVSVSVGVAGRLPPRGARVSLFTELVVKEDGWSLYGFDTAVERLVFRYLLVSVLNSQSPCCPRWVRSEPSGAFKPGTCQP
jgi:Holliday junction DNA helicase RuvA